MKLLSRIFWSILFGTIFGAVALAANLLLPVLFHFQGCVQAGVAAVLACNLARMRVGKPLLSPWWLLIFWAILGSLLGFMFAMFFLYALLLPALPSWAAIMGLMAAIGSYLGFGDKQVLLSSTDKN